jgi:hypothetical protein
MDQLQRNLKQNWKAKSKIKSGIINIHTRNNEKYRKERERNDATKGGKIKEGYVLRILVAWIC